MCARLVPAAAVVLAIGWMASAQPPTGREQPAKPADAKAVGTSEPKDGAVFEVRLADDTQMKVVLLDTELTVKTKYGKLTIPAADIRRLDFGFRYPEGMQEKVDKAIAQLGADEFRDREAAEQALVGYERYSIPGLRRAVKSDNPEIVRRAQAVLKIVEAKLGPEKTELRDYDIVETAEFTLRGQVEIGVLKLRTRFFGEVTARVTDIRAFRAVGSVAGAEFALDADKYAKVNQGSWLETAVEVNAGQQLEITVTGKIDMWPQGPNQYMSEPTGLSGYTQPGVPARLGIPGQVVGRIGSNGTQFAVGAGFKGKVTESGKLYLRIHPSPWNNDSSGSYKVKVTVTEP